MFGPPSLFSLIGLFCQGGFSIKLGGRLYWDEKMAGDCAWVWAEGDACFLGLLRGGFGLLSPVLLCSCASFSLCWVFQVCYSDTTVSSL